jgi:hypothetical protein
MINSFYKKMIFFICETYITLLIYKINNKMSFSNTNIYISLNNNLEELNIDNNNLEYGDTLNYLIGNMENYFSKSDNKNNISFDKNNISIHKLKTNKDICLWSNNVLRNNKDYDDIEIEDNSIYCLKFKNMYNIEIPKFIKSGIDINNKAIYNKVIFSDFKSNYSINYISCENNIHNLVLITDKYQLFFKYLKDENKYIIEKSINIEPKLSFTSRIEVNKNNSILEKYGYGKIIYSDGLIYDGKFIFSDINSFNFCNGTATYSDGTVMIGNFVKLHNKIFLSDGIINYSDGRVLEGVFDESYFAFNKYILLNNKLIDQDTVVNKKRKFSEEDILN